MTSIIHNESLEQWSAAYTGPKFHAVLCDPPYGLEFMGKEWDAPHKASSFPKRGNLGGFADGNKPSFARQGDLSRLSDVYRVWGEAILPHLFPGALVLMFGGTRTWHRLACGMEDAGFEIWDTLMWLHGQGFPKAQDISKLIDKQNGDEREVTAENPFASRRPRADHSSQGMTFADDSYVRPAGDAPVTTPGSPLSAPWLGYKTTALKPAWEPVLCFKKPLTGTYADMALQYGSGALNVDGGRIVTDDSLGGGAELNRQSQKPEGWDRPWRNDPEAAAAHAARIRDNVQKAQSLGRYPANLILDPESAALLDEQTGELCSGQSKPEYRKKAGANVYGKYRNEDMPINVIGDSGGASRFYYCPKSSSWERSAGLDGFEARVKSVDYRQPTGNPMVDRIHGCGIPKRNHHPTVKPIDLCRYLATLLLPPESVKPRRLLVPFAGSGSEMIGAMLAGWDEIVGIEQDKEHGYVQIAEARLDWWKWAAGESRLSDPTAILERFGMRDTDDTQPGLFDEAPKQLTLDPK
jgi:site-specific DNA-methyltransferase (adenine-specific)